MSSKRGRGRPRKPADIKYPRRINSTKLIQELHNDNGKLSSDRGFSGQMPSDNTDTGNSQESTQRDKRAIVLSDTTTADIPQEEATSDEVQAHPEVVNYRCNDCGALLMAKQPRCSCGSRLHWDRVNVS